MAEDQKGRWLGRKPEGQKDTHSWKAFLKKTPARALDAHLQRHHRGLKPK